MTFKELAYQEAPSLRPAFRDQPEPSLLAVVFTNHSPVMKWWFLAMVMNIVGFSFLFTL